MKVFKKKKVLDEVLTNCYTVFVAIQHKPMIKSFKCKETERLFNDDPVKQFKAIETTARRKLELLDAATSIDILAAIPGNRLERLKGNRKDQWSIRINNQWRLCFVWIDQDAYNVEICDYH